VEQIAQAFEAAAGRARKRVAVNGSPWTNSEGAIHPSNRTGDAAGVEKYIEREDQRPANCWAPDVWRRLIYAAIVACIVQWSSTGSALLAAWMTPTVGLG
jgi:hypothetical protein